MALCRQLPESFCSRLAKVKNNSQELKANSFDNCGASTSKPLASNRTGTATATTTVKKRRPPKLVYNEILSFAYEAFRSNKVRFALTAQGTVIGTVSLDTVR
jgi:hypothetical protein